MNVSQIALGSLLVSKLWIIPVPGTTKLNQLTENLGALPFELRIKNQYQIKEATPKSPNKKHVIPNSISV